MHQKPNPLNQALALGLGMIILILALPGAAIAVNLLVNGPFESFQNYGSHTWRGFQEKYGTGWTLKVVYDDDEGLHVMDSDSFGRFLAQEYHLSYLNYRLEGNYSQVFVSRRAFTTVLSQTVGVAAGQDYALGGKIVSFWKGPDNDIDHTKIFKRVGVDPNGGTDYAAASVQWTDWDGTDNAWTSPALAVTAQGSQATVFIQVNNTGADVGAAYLNPVYIDNFKFELAPVASLTLPAQAAPGPVPVSWGVSIPDTGFWELWGYDVEYKDNALGVWQPVQSHTGAGSTNTGFTLNAESGKSYTVRVRPWQQQKGGGSPITTAMPGMWQEKNVVIGQAIVGQVTTHAGLGLAGVTVAISGTGISTVSTGSGYALPTGSDGTFNIKASDFGSFAAPPAGAAATTAAAVGRLDITMRPTGSLQGLNNNDFEVDTQGWALTGAAARSAADKHTGSGSLLLTSGSSAAQSNAVNGMVRPLLSFWYKTDTDATVTVQFLGPSGPVQSTVFGPAPAWTHVTLDSGLGDSYTGPVGVNFSHASGGNIFVDEVSIAAGVYKTFLPVVLKN